MRKTGKLLKVVAGQLEPRQGVERGVSPLIDGLTEGFRLAPGRLGSSERKMDPAWPRAFTFVHRMSACRNSEPYPAPLQRSCWTPMLGAHSKDSGFPCRWNICSAYQGSALRVVRLFRGAYILGHQLRIRSAQGARKGQTPWRFTAQSDRQ